MRRQPLSAFLGILRLRAIAPFSSVFFYSLSRCIRGAELPHGNLLLAWRFSGSGTQRKPQRRALGVIRSARFSNNQKNSPDDFRTPLAVSQRSDATFSTAQASANQSTQVVGNGRSFNAIQPSHFHRVHSGLAPFHPVNYPESLQQQHDGSEFDHKFTPPSKTMSSPQKRTTLPIHSTRLLTPESVPGASLSLQTEPEDLVDDQPASGHLAPSWQQSGTADPKVKQVLQAALLCTMTSMDIVLTKDRLKPLMLPYLKTSTDHFAPFHETDVEQKPAARTRVLPRALIEADLTGNASNILRSSTSFHGSRIPTRCLGQLQSLYTKSGTSAGTSINSNLHSKLSYQQLGTHTKKKLRGNKNSPIDYLDTSKNHSKMPNQYTNNTLAGFYGHLDWSKCHPMVQSQYRDPITNNTKTVWLTHFQAPKPWMSVDASCTCITQPDLGEYPINSIPVDSSTSSCTGTFYASQGATYGTNSSKSSKEVHTNVEDLFLSWRQRHNTAKYLQRPAASLHKKETGKRTGIGSSNSLAWPFSSSHDVSPWLDPAVGASLLEVHTASSPEENNSELSTTNEKSPLQSTRVTFRTEFISRQQYQYSFPTTCDFSIPRSVNSTKPDVLLLDSRMSVAYSRVLRSDRRKQNNDPKYEKMFSNYNATNGVASQALGDMRQHKLATPSKVTGGPSSIEISDPLLASGLPSVSVNDQTQSLANSRLLKQVIIKHGCPVSGKWDFRIESMKSFPFQTKTHNSTEVQEATNLNYTNSTDNLFMSEVVMSLSLHGLDGTPLGVYLQEHDGRHPILTPRLTCHVIPLPSRKGKQSLLTAEDLLGRCVTQGPNERLKKFGSRGHNGRNDPNALLPDGSRMATAAKSREIVVDPVVESLFSRDVEEEARDWWLEEADVVRKLIERYSTTSNASEFEDHSMFYTVNNKFQQTCATRNTEDNWRHSNPCFSSAAFSAFKSQEEHMKPPSSQRLLSPCTADLDRGYFWMQKSQRSTGLPVSPVVRCKPTPRRVVDIDLEVFEAAMNPQDFRQRKVLELAHVAVPQLLVSENFDINTILAPPTVNVVGDQKLREKKDNPETLRSHGTASSPRNRSHLWGKPRAAIRQLTETVDISAKRLPAEDIPFRLSSNFHVPDVSHLHSNREASTMTHGTNNEGGFNESPTSTPLKVDEDVKSAEFLQSFASKTPRVPHTHHGIAGIGRYVPVENSFLQQVVNQVSYGPWWTKWGRNKVDRTTHVQLASDFGFIEGGIDGNQREATVSGGWGNYITTVTWNEVRQEASSAIAVGNYGVKVDRSQALNATAVEIIARGFQSGTILNNVDRNFGQRFKIRNFEISIKHDFDDYFYPADGEFGTELLVQWRAINTAIASDLAEKRLGVTVGIRGYNVALLRDFDQFLSVFQANWGRGWQLALESDFPDLYSANSFVGIGFGRLNRFFGQVGVGVGDDGVPQASARVQTRNMAVSLDFLNEIGQRIFQYAISVGRFTYAWQADIDLTSVRIPNFLFGATPGDIEKVLLALLPHHRSSMQLPT